MSGHYTFASEEFNELKDEVGLSLSHRNIELNKLLRLAVKEKISRYVNLFGLYRATL